MSSSRRRLPRLTVNWQWRFIAFRCQKKKQAAEKKTFLLLLTAGLGGFAVSILLFGFPKAGAYGSYGGWEGWGIGVVGLFAAWRHKKKISNDTSEKSE